MWEDIVALSTLPSMSYLTGLVAKEGKAFKAWYASDSPHTHELPSALASTTPLQVPHGGC